MISSTQKMVLVIGIVLYAAFGFLPIVPHVMMTEAMESHGEVMPMDSSDCFDHCIQEAVQTTNNSILIVFLVFFAIAAAIVVVLPLLQRTLLYYRCNERVGPLYLFTTVQLLE